jgi:pimeloyl-ACP methyl ester carboxylesterase
VTAVKHILVLQSGPSILVAHSYGGAVITEAGTDPSVAGLVYVAAHMPDSGEKESDDGKRFPSDLAKSGAIKKTPDGFTYIDPAQFHDQPGLGALVCQAGREPHGRSRRRQPLSLRLASQGGRRCN